jgi:hypothetical protein
MKTLIAMPTRLMRGQANGSMRDMCDIYRDDGYGWEQKGRTRCLVHHLLKPPVSGDPMDANTATTETVGIGIPRSIPARVGDRIYARGHRWTVGDGNFSETYGSYLYVTCARPSAGVPRVWITIRRYNHNTQAWESLSPQLAQVAWSRNQPDRLGGVAVRQFGWIFAPEESATDLDIQQGDSFFFGGEDHTVQWVPPDPTERREAIFFTNTGEGV